VRRSAFWLFVTEALGELKPRAPFILGRLASVNPIMHPAGGSCRGLFRAQGFSAMHLTVYAHHVMLSGLRPMSKR